MSMQLDVTDVLKIQDAIGGLNKELLEAMFFITVLRILEEGHWGADKALTVLHQSRARAIKR